MDRLRGRDGSSPDDTGPVEDEAFADDLEPVEEIGIRHLTPDEQATLEEARARYGELGIDPADLDTVAAAYDRAVDAHVEGDASSAVDVIGTAIGDHLVLAGYRWVVSIDPFGTDLAVEPPRRGVPVVTRMLVAVRWMSREKGWVTGVTEHLARAGSH
ncbi:hypothetical protein [Oryzobacter telluris]|uniref:hypothetical protein n=1 Tax=Oryzobacter telluris TaxID=3149179 RepID=UPI00370D4A42